MMSKIWNGQLTRKIERDYRISLCKTCMGRLPDLMKTLPVNLELNQAYPHLEFVILDYNSQDGLADWVRQNLSWEMESGRVVYVRTDAPRYYSMTHSRNVAFLAASGDIVCNVDADNFTLDLSLEDSRRPTVCFAEYLNRLANQAQARAIFAKGKRMLRGRLGFFRDEFLHELGGYDEELQGYGHDDHDLLQRAWGLGYELYWFGGQYLERLKTSSAQRNENMEVKNWKQTQELNRVRSQQSLAEGRLRANVGRSWGQARLMRNFTEELHVGAAAIPEVISDVASTV